MLSTLRSTCIHFLLLNISVLGKKSRSDAYQQKRKKNSRGKKRKEIVSIGNVTTWFALSLNLVFSFPFFFFLYRTRVCPDTKSNADFVSKRIDFYGGLRGG